MKVAVACEGSKVSKHFGHCEGFNIFNMKDGKIMDSKYVQNPAEHQHGYLPVLLNDMGVNVVIAGGIGGGAMELLKQKAIQVITVAIEDVEPVINKYISGDLKAIESECHEHHHDHNCGGHH